MFVRIPHNELTMFLMQLLNVWREILRIYASIPLLWKHLPPDMSTLPFLLVSAVITVTVWWRFPPSLIPSTCVNWDSVTRTCQLSLMYLFIAVWTHRYLLLSLVSNLIRSFILWLRWFQLWPLEALSGGSLAPLICSCFFSSSLLSGTTRDSRFSFYHFLPQS